MNISYTGLENLISEINKKNVPSFEIIKDVISYVAEYERLKSKNDQNRIDYVRLCLDIKYNGDKK